MTSRGLEATSLGANLTSQQIQSLVNSGSMTAQEANLLMQNAGQRQQLAGLNLNRESFMRSGERDMALELLQGAEADVEKEYQNRITDATLRAQINMFNQQQRQQANNQQTQNLISLGKIATSLYNPSAGLALDQAVPQQTVQPTQQTSSMIRPVQPMSRRTMTVNNPYSGFAPSAPTAYTNPYSMDTTPRYNPTTSGIMDYRDFR